MKDHTSYGIATYINGNFSSGWHDVYYKDFKSYDDLPEVCKSEETNKEYDEFHKVSGSAGKELND